jgi:hypothetical protein
MLSAFAFEGMLKFCGSLLHGTRGYGNQIGQHPGAENYLNFNAEDKFSTMHNLQLKSFCNKLRNKSLHKHGIIGSCSISSFVAIGILEYHEFFNSNETFCYHDEIRNGIRAIFQKTGILFIFNLSFFNSLIHYLRNAPSLSFS